MDPIPIGNRIKAARLGKNLTQTELADQCRLHIRTIQRIENGETIPHAYTLRLINDVLETDFVMEPSGSDEKDLPQLRSIFRRRKKIRQISIISVVVFLILVGFVVLPVTRALDIPRLAWAPFVYLIMFGYIIGIALTWRCPGCGALLGDAFNTRFCSKCGLRFYEE
jgi:transcriptional regulator with XRE-family HTH domain